MKVIRFSLLGAATLALVLTFAFLTSCEKDGGNSDISGQISDYSSDPRLATLQVNEALVISPEAATVSREGDTVLFTITAAASSGPFSWNVGEEANGTIHPTGTGNQALFKTVRPVNNFVYVRDELGNAGVAVINSGSSNGITISPAVANVTRVGQTVVFTISSGGRAPYSWTRADQTAGTLSISPDTRQVTYTASQVKQNNLMVTDPDGLTAVAEITRSITTLSMQPSGAYTMVGPNANYTAVGGSAPYSWSVVSSGVAPALGTVAPAAGATTVYTRTAAVGTNTIILIDAEGSTASGTIIQN